MVKLSIKNITNCIDNELITNNLQSNPFIISISEKTKIDTSFNKFLTLALKYNILIFEKSIDESWTIKSKQNILNQIEKLIRTVYNDHIINITQISIESNDAKIFTNIKQTLDKLHNGLKKKLIDLYEIKSILEIIDLNLQSDKKIKKKKIINNDIYIEEFSN
jgi:hypothetical protein